MLELSQTDENIIHMIDYLRKEKKKRPSMKDIFEGINKNVEDKINFSVFKDVMGNLQSLNIIYDGGKDGKESFFVNEKNAFDSLNEDRNLNNVNKSTDADGNNFENLFQYIDEKYHDVLINRIKTEVKNEVRMLINDDYLLQFRIRIRAIQIILEQIQYIKRRMQQTNI